MAALALEICVDTPHGVRAAADADRIELCSALALGGLTPGADLIAAATTVPAHAMIRPRARDFVFDQAYISACLVDIAQMRAAGLAGVVIGSARPDGQLDAANLARMIDAAGNLSITLHRVIDTMPDPVVSVGIAIELGTTRVLTSGGAVRVGEGLETIRAMVNAAAGRIEIMAGGGLRLEDVRALQRIGVDAAHASSGTKHVPRGMVGKIGLPSDQTVADPAKIILLRQAMAAGEAA